MEDLMFEWPDKIFDESYKAVANAEGPGQMVPMTREQAYTSRLLSAIRMLIQHNWSLYEACASIVGAGMANYHQYVDKEALQKVEFYEDNTRTPTWYSALSFTRMVLEEMLKGFHNIKQAEAQIKIVIRSVYENRKQAGYALESDGSDLGAGGDGNDQ